ncbi:MAG: sugar phosphate isomerase/epimerase [Armatimonadetes bacterium]|nr:sugar phosphate isomerase/epimerase [Armatimonadota bacterium]
MELGLSLHALTKFGDDRRPFDDALRLARRAGADHVMLLSMPGGPNVQPAQPCPATLVDAVASDPEELLWLVGKAGLYLGLLYTGGVDVRSDEAAEACLPGLRSHAALCQRLGVSILAHSVGPAPERFLSTADKSAEIERLAALMERITAEFNLRTAADVHIGGTVETMEDVRYYQSVARDAMVGIILNIGHMTTGGQPGWELLGDRSVRVPVLAWKDHLYPPPSTEQPVVSVELGQGKSPFDKYAQVLKGRRDKPLSLVSYENVPYEAEPVVAARSLAYLREVWRRAGLS